MPDGAPWFRFPETFSLVKHISTKNVVSAPLTLCVVTTVTAGVVAAFSKNEVVAGAFVGLALCVDIGLGVAYWYWSRNDPNRLQDEKTQLAMRKMELLGDKHHRAAQIDLQPVQNPVTERLLESGR